MARHDVNAIAPMAPKRPEKRLQQNLQQAATNFEKAATNGLFFGAFVAGYFNGLS
jgi:hypothetical protein